MKAAFLTALVLVVLTAILAILREELGGRWQNLFLGSSLIFAWVVVSYTEAGAGLLLVATAAMVGSAAFAWLSIRLQAPR